MTYYFREECMGAHHGFSDMKLMAIGQHGQVMGYIDYGVDSSKTTVYIQYVHVLPKYTRKGLGTALVRKLQLEYPDREIDWGGTTPEGEALRTSLKYREVPNKRYSSLMARMNRFKKEHTDTEAWFDTLKKPIAKTPGGKERADRWQRIDQLLWKINHELGDQKPAHRFIESIHEAWGGVGNWVDFILDSAPRLWSLKELRVEDHPDGVAVLASRAGFKDLDEAGLDEFAKRRHLIRVVRENDTLWFQRGNYSMSRMQYSFLKDYAIEHGLEVREDRDGSS